MKKINYGLLITLLILGLLSLYILLRSNYIEDEKILKKGNFQSLVLEQFKVKTFDEMTITKFSVDSATEIAKIEDKKHITEFLNYLNKFELIEEISFTDRDDKQDENTRYKSKKEKYEYLKERVELDNAILYKEDILYYIA